MQSKYGQLLWEITCWFFIFVSRFHMYIYIKKNITEKKIFTGSHKSSKSSKIVK